MINVSRWVPHAKQILPSMLISVGLNVLTIGSAVALMGTSSYLITMAGFHPSIADLQVAIVGVRLFGISRGVFRYLERLVSHAINFQILTRLRVQFFSRYEAAFPITQWPVEQGDLIHRVLDDIDTLENLYVRIISPAAAAFMITILASFVLSTFQPNLGLILFLGLILSGFLIPLLTTLSVQKIGAEIQKIKGIYRAQLTRTLLGAEEILVFGLKKTATDYLGKKVKQLQKREDQLDALAEVINLLNYGLQQTAFVLTLIYAIQAAQAGGLNPVLISVSAMIVLASFEATQPLGMAAVQLGKVREALKRLAQIPAEARIEKSIDSDPPAEIAEIQFSNVRFSYECQQAPAVDQISFSIQRGKKLAIVGPSGSGKSTLLQLIQGFRCPQQGEIYINQQSLNSLNGDHLRKFLAVAGQSPFLFHRSLRHNLTFGNSEISDEACEQVLRQVNLQPWFSSLKDGLDTMLHEAAVNISAGEKQRLAIARAFLKPASFLILDEPTANLDAETEDGLMRCILAESKDKGLIWVSHRMKYLTYFDEILFLDQGVIIERGTEDELLQKGGVYAHYWQLQNEFLA